ncbi:hypothetical protein FPANT_5677 [Fusarium pseudoanthophilum]|uniref:NACHT domain-containing protein n=1 Tax=Fusarium pseudoanthophilum TaxID=48495 RepID=A0A8H5P7B0_9HYPO|nr:hypothetical protein FPANT_5677 [Fusarium pseudoanthophilum]
MISASRSLGRDIEILETKLDVEEMILLQWADRNLLSEGQALEARYGLQRSNTPHAAVNSHQPTSASRMERFLREFANLRLERSKSGGSNKSKSATAIQKVRWIIVDKEKFSQLISDLSYFTSRLHVLIPEAPMDRARMTEQDLSHLRSIAALKVIEEACAETQPVVATEASREISVMETAIQERVLRCLWFRWIDDRRANIHEAHFKTLHWVLDPPARTVTKWDDLRLWLQSGSGVYWIAGKAGSGKSTLMNYLLGRGLMKSLLENWSGSSDLLMINFFFYHLGKTEQKSQAGLLRSLLWQILDTHPAAIEAVLPNTWREAQGDNSKGLSVPTVSEMTGALMNFCKTYLVDRKLFLLIDGLDEYEGSDLDTANFIEKLSMMKNVKILVSTHLPDLTRDDITAYVNDKVASHPRFLEISQTEGPDGTPHIIEELVEKASGVFLWVVLACRSVMEGLVAYDSISDIKARVAELPREVERLFEHMISRIEPRWRQEALRLLRLAHANQSLAGTTSIPTLGLHMISTQGFQAGATIQKDNSIYTSGKGNRMKCVVMEGRLRSRCCGLLEVEKHFLGQGGFCACANDGKHDEMIDSGVIFMHRTVYDFLSTPHIWEQEFMRIEDTAFNSHATLSLLWSRLGTVFCAKPRTLEISIGMALAHAYYGDLTGCSLEITVANLVNLQLIPRSSRSGPFWFRRESCRRDCCSCEKCLGNLSLGLAYAIELGLHRVTKFIFENTDYIYGLPISASEGATQSSFYTGSDKICRKHIAETVHPALYHAACWPLLQDIPVKYPALQKCMSAMPSSDMVRHLLQRAHSPNEGFTIQWTGTSAKSTPWIEWIRMNDTPSTRPLIAAEEIAEITMIFLQAGADVAQLRSSDLEKLERLAAGNVSSLSGVQAAPPRVARQKETWDAVRSIMERKLTSKSCAAAGTSDESCATKRSPSPPTTTTAIYQIRKRPKFTWMPPQSVCMVTF